MQEHFRIAMAFFTENAGERLKTNPTYPNDFDLAFAEPPPSSTTTAQLAQAARPWLDLWLAQHPTRLPSKEEVQSLAVLTGASSAQITAWMKPRQHTVLTPPPQPSPSPPYTNNSSAQPQPPSTPKAPYRPKCLESRWRYRYRGPQQPEDDAAAAANKPALIFECTHRCGRTFPRARKGDWGRHERANFEEWVCPHCSGVLSRREKLRDHLRDFHSCSTAADVAQVRDEHRRLTLQAAQRPCGFCGAQFASWAEWLAHVGMHFEGVLAGGRKSMLLWREGWRMGDDNLYAGAGDVDVDVEMEMDIDVDQGDGDAESTTDMTEPSSSCYTTTPTTTTTTAADSGFFSYYDTPSIAPSSHNYSNSNSTSTSNSSPHRPHSHRGHDIHYPTSISTMAAAGRIVAPPILANPRCDVYNAPAPTAGQPYAWPDPENQWSLQTMQSLLSCWPE